MELASVGRPRLASKSIWYFIAESCFSKAPISLYQNISSSFFEETLFIIISFPYHTIWIVCTTSNNKPDLIIEFPC